MLEITDLPEQRTTTDLVFDRLREEIVSLALLPGTKLSEAEVARRFGVSRQPVRDAFNRLANLDLLLIRPQRATEVRGFSMERIAHARFVRLAVELEVVRHACTLWDEERAAILERNVDAQANVIAEGRPEAFHALDYEFHKLICELGGCPLALETVRDCKQKVDRLCMLGLGREREATVLLTDHQKLAGALRDRNADRAVSVLREHLGRLDGVVLELHARHEAYFE
ncbi:MAG: GntR family transcriptional regulator [Pseudomonadota bacterium]